MTTTAPIPEDEEEEEGSFEVSAITSSDGTRLKPGEPPRSAADILGVAEYAASDSETDSGSDDDDDDDQHNPRPSANENGADSQKENGNMPVKRSGEPLGDGPSKRKRVRFAVAEDGLDVDEAQEVQDPVVLVPSGEEDAELDVAFAAFEAEVAGAAEDADERDMDLAEAEDAREEAVQQELQRRVQRMRARLKGEAGEAAAQGATFSVGGEEITLKMRGKRRDKGDEMEESDSEGEIDLMRDWTQFIG